MVVTAVGRGLLYEVNGFHAVRVILLGIFTVRLWRHCKRRVHTLEQFALSPVSLDVSFHHPAVIKRYKNMIAVIGNIVL